jgi:Rrf2 family nitric oxide-sensitive transcriptional repressor
MDLRYVISRLSGFVMLGKTSISAIRTLLYLARQESDACLPPRKLAEALGESPTYLAKVTRHMVKQGILEAEKGVKGGVRLVLPLHEITLLSIVEACQGTIVGDYCRSNKPLDSTCSFHQAAMELHEAITGVLKRWTVADLLQKPAADASGGGISCLIARGMTVPAFERTAHAAASLAVHQIKGIS